ncbi:MAG: 1-acyl-sn-glycerol-3-phosphate acyltransferase [Alkalispirochaeta sp.]
MEATGAKQIDVVQMLQSKNPRIAAGLPAVVLRGLERVAHQRELRAFLREVDSCGGCEFVERALKRLAITVKVEGREHLPPSPRFVLCANHPTGGIDGLVLMQLLCRRYGGLLVPANDLLLGLTGLSELLVPINKYGSNHDRFAHLVAAYESSQPILVFPAGRTARVRGGAVTGGPRTDGPRPGGPHTVGPLTGGVRRGGARRRSVGGGELREYPWNKAFLKLARRSNRVVVPVGLSGRNSALFYAIWKVRRALGIQLNLEMFLLMDELVRQRGSTRRIVIAPPMEPGPSRDDHRIAQQLRRTVERLTRNENSPVKGRLTGTEERVVCP